MPWEPSRVSPGSAASRRCRARPRWRTPAPRSSQLSRATSTLTTTPAPTGSQGTAPAADRHLSLAGPRVSTRGAAGLYDYGERPLLAAPVCAAGALALRSAYKRGGDVQGPVPRAAGAP